MAYLGGPTIANIISALSIFHPESLIEISEGWTEIGWILGEHWLYSETTWNDPLVDTSDGIVIQELEAEAYRWSVTFYESWRLSTSVRTTLESIIDDMKPAHTVVYIFYV